MEAQSNTTSFDWSGIGGREEGATGRARTDVQRLARALAAHSIAVERDAVVEEFGERLRTIQSTMWPADPLAGYGLHSSLGAYFVAKVAVGMVPSGSHGLRHEPLRRDGLFAGLVELGVEEDVAHSVIGDWSGVSDGFKGDRQGLETTSLAGVAERTLTRVERDSALSQVAVSPRCLQRLASTCHLIEAARVVMPVLPPESMGSDLATAMAAMALGRPDRVMELFADRTETLALRTIVELAAAQWTLGRVEPMYFEYDDDVLGLPDDGDAWEAETARGESAEEDVLEIVEERVDPSYLASPHRAGAVPRPPKWSPVEIGETMLGDWNDLRRRAQAGHGARILGMDVRGRRIAVPPIPVPPDPRFVRDLMSEIDAQREGATTQKIAVSQMLDQPFVKDGSIFSPLFPPVRGALRAVAGAAEGRAPSEAAIASAGDLTWVIRRARALAMIVRGDLEAARAAVEGMPIDAAPEARWVKDRALRYAGRQQVPVTPEEARPAAAALVQDLASQLARTIAGSVGEGGRP